jgi:hypothetical protein
VLLPPPGVLRTGCPPSVRSETTSASRRVQWLATASTGNGPCAMATHSWRASADLLAELCQQSADVARESRQIVTSARSTRARSRAIRKRVAERRLLGDSPTRPARLKS